MLCASALSMPIRFPRVKCGLIVLSAILLMPAAARAQTATGGGISISAGDATIHTSTATVNGATGPVATVAVELDGVASNGSSYSSMQNAWFMLTSPGPGGAQFAFLGGTGDGYDGCDSNTDTGCDGLQGTSADIITVTDSAQYIAPPGTGSPQGQFGGWLTSDMPYTVRPSSYGAFGYNNPPLPTTPNQADWPQTDGCAQPQAMNETYGCTDGPNGTTTPTFNSRFKNLSADGTWTLSLIDGTDPVSITGWKLYLTYGTAVVIQTTTALSSSPNPVTYANSTTSATVTLTAFVATSPTGQGTPTGTVAFTANGTTLSGCGAVTLTGGQAQCVASLAQGGNAIIATYAPTGNFVTSSGTMTELVEVTGFTASGNKWCNNSPITEPTDGIPLAYPAVITVSGYPNGTTVGNVNVILNGVSGASGFADQFLLVAPGGGTHNLDFLDYAWSLSASGVSFTVSDANSTLPDQNSSPANGSTYLPFDGDKNSAMPAFTSSLAPGIDSNIPQVPSTINDPQSVGAYTLEHAFGGAPANGDWALYINGDEAVSVGSWCVDLSINSGSATTTSVSSNNQRATHGQSVTFTATVTSTETVNEGTVAFVDTTTGTTLAGNVPVSNDSATFSTSALAEGDHSITATYSGTSNYNTSYGTWEQRVDDATTVTNAGGDTWNFCNTGPVQIQESISGAYTPNPSNIFVSGFPGTFDSAAVTLKNFSVPSVTAYETESLIEGPGSTHPALDFFSNVIGVSNTADIALGNYTFADSASGLVPENGSSISPGPYQPTAYAYWSGGSDTFTSSYFYPVPSSFSLAAPAASGTFADVFPNTLNPNGAWSLFFNQHYPENAQIDGAANGWCVQLTGTPPTVTVSTENTDTFTQGQQNASLTINIDNNGSTGPTGDPTAGSNPMTVTDTLNSAFTFASGSGGGWNCSGSSGQNVSCTNDSAIAQGNSYPTLTIEVNVGSASGNVSNSVSVSGAGVSTTTSNTDTITINPVPVNIAAAFSPSSIAAGGSSSLTITLANPTAFSQSSVAFSDTLPAGITVASAANLTNTGCGGTAAAISGGTTLSLSGGSLAANTSCTVSVNVTSTTPGLATDTTGAVSSTPGGTGLTANASLTIEDITPVVTLSPIPAMVNRGTPTSLTATFTTIAGAPAPTANMNFYAGTTLLGSATLGSYNSATYTYTATGTFSNLPVGTQSIIATYPGDSSYLTNSSAGQSTYVIANDLWIGDSNNTTAAFSATGTPYPLSPELGSGSGGVAIDGAGNVWTLNTGSSSVSEFTSKGTVTNGPFTDGGLSAPSALAIDGLDQVWIVNSTNSISVFNSSGTAISTTAYTGAGLSSPTSVAIDISGNLWLIFYTTVSEVIDYQRVAVLETA